MAVPELMDSDFVDSDLSRDLNEGIEWKITTPVSFIKLHFLGIWFVYQSFMEPASLLILSQFKQIN